MDQEGDRLLDALTDTSRIRLTEFLEEPFRIQHSLADGIARHGLYTPGDLSPTYQYLLGTYKSLYLEREQISVMSFGSEAGEYAGMRREPRGEGFTLMLKDASTQSRLRIYKGESPGEVTAEFPSYDPRVRPWYAPVKQSGKAGWSAIYTNMDERAEITISAMSPVNVGGKMIGVMEASIKLDGINRFLQNERLRGQGLILLVDVEGRLIAHSEQGSVVAEGNGFSKRGERMLMTESAVPLVRAAAAHVMAAPTESRASFKLVSGGERYFGRVSPHSDARGLDWRVVVMVPEADLLGDVRSGSRKSLLWAMAFALVGLLLGLWLIQRVTRPILKTAEAANHLAGGRWDTGIDAGDTLRETAILVRAFNEMADRLQRSFNDLRAQLIYDNLTQFLTRRGFLEKVDWVEPRPAVLALIGLDAFRTINDNLGYSTGDRLLQAISGRMRERLGAPVLMARVGGDEFAVLFQQTSIDQDVTELGETVLSVFSTPFSAGADEVMVAASVGLVGGKLRQAGMADWLRSASVALGEAKRRGRSHVVVFEQDMMAQSLQRAKLSNELRQALERDQFLIHYQPVIDLTSGRVTGAEALLRWLSPERGMVSPGLFIPVAEESDLILALGEWVLRTATQAIAQRLPELAADFELHVNVSARQLIQSDFTFTLRQALQDSGLPPQHLTLELTESLLIGEDSVIEERLRDIRAMGIRIAIDDFGTGYSSLAYLSRLPFDSLKIDQSFVRKMFNSSQDKAIIAAVLHMAQGFDVEVVAEGVETEAETQLLREMGCSHAQGYYLGRPALLEKLDTRSRAISSA
ncbi:EAL domain-containing protein [Roseateles sp.]|uniref:bifunctional diguanylate cyclase/phosphodiesterase n=1 Tax=Roseateles sp. TaxID=1971397 RepID=UPI0037C8D5FB